MREQSLFGDNIQGNPREKKLEWITDHGAMPGEPFMLYGGDLETAPLAIVPIDVGKVEDEYELRDDQGNILKRGTDIEELQHLGEKIYAEKYAYPNPRGFEVIFYRKGIDENFYEFAEYFKTYPEAKKFFEHEIMERNLDEYYITLIDSADRLITDSDAAIKRRNPRRDIARYRVAEPKNYPGHGIKFVYGIKKGAPKRNPSITSNEAKDIVKRFLDEKRLPCTKLTAGHVDFTDLARETPLFITVHGWQPNPLAADLKLLARSNGFYVNFK